MEYKGIKIEECEGVYPPSDDTFLIIENAQCSGRSVEIGCGSGIVSIYFRKRGCNIMAADIDGRAVECTKHNASLNGVSLDVVESDLFSNISGTFDTILFNAPYLPVDNEDAAWSGGHDLEVVRRFLRDSKGHANLGTSIYVVLTDLTDNEEIFSSLGFSYRAVRSITFEFESIILYELHMMR